MKTECAAIAPYKGVWSVLRQYWRIYGGIEKLLLSPYLHISVIVSILMPLWKHAEWYDVPLGVLPSILGFSLAGYAMFLAFGDASFRDLLAADYQDGKPSPFMGFNATFMHFILVQVVAIILAINALARDEKSNLIAFVSCVIFIYSIFTALASAVEIFRCARLFDAHVKTRGGCQ